MITLLLMACNPTSAVRVSSPAPEPAAPEPAPAPAPAPASPAPAPAEEPTPAPSGLPAGAACLEGAQCASGVCEGEGCDEASPGVCAEEERACTTDLVPYCGCDGETFRSSGTCPQRRYEYEGPCEETEEVPD